MRKAQLGCAFVCSLLIVGGLTVAGCGNSSSGDPSEAQLEKAKEEGERIAQERARVDDLEKELRNLKRSAKPTRTDATPDAGPDTSTPLPGEESESSRTFHAPSGNVSCVIASSEAFCTVASIATTFRVEDGEPGRIESSAPLPRGSGELAEYGSTVSAGTVSCTIPAADEPRGITCVDNSSGHGFEASRISSRQSTF